MSKSTRQQIEKTMRGLHGYICVVSKRVTVPASTLLQHNIGPALESTLHSEAICQRIKTQPHLLLLPLPTSRSPESQLFLRFARLQES